MGWCLRYQSDQATEGLPPGEGAFLACSFWLADNYVLQGRFEEARALFQRLLALAKRCGTSRGRIRPRDPSANWAISRKRSRILALINTARNLSGAGPAHDRSSAKPAPAAIRAKIDAGAT